MSRMLLIGALLCGPTWAGPDSPGSGSWAELGDQCAGLGSTQKQACQTLDICRRRGLTLSDANQLLGPVYAAKAESLPACRICEKIDEGLSKQASVSNIIQAAEARLNYMRQANEMITSVVGDGDGHGKGRTMLIENIGMALESGLDPAVLEAVIRHNGHRQLGRLAHVMEAAETLHLDGFEDRHLQRVLIDFLDRNLNRHEMYRAVDVLREGLKNGKDFETIYSSLWVASR